jgi:hypothetical protein
MLVRGIVNPRHGVHVLTIPHSATSATVVSYSGSAAAVELDCLAPDQPVSRRSWKLAPIHDAAPTLTRTSSRARRHRSLTNVAR